jgi:hypothetical protein
MKHSVLHTALAAVATPGAGMAPGVSCLGLVAIPDGYTRLRTMVA